MTPAKFMMTGKYEIIFDKTVTAFLEKIIRRAILISLNFVHSRRERLNLGRTLFEHNLWTPDRPRVPSQFCSATCDKRGGSFRNLQYLQVLFEAEIGQAQWYSL
jgi:hypothetical protein